MRIILFKIILLLKTRQHLNNILDNKLIKKVIGGNIIKNIKLVIFVVAIAFLIGLTTSSAENVTAEDKITASANSIANANVEKTNENAIQKETTTINEDKQVSTTNDKSIDTTANDAKKISTKKDNKTLKTASATKNSTKMTVSNKTIYHGEKVQLTTTVVDKNTGKYLQNGKVAFKINGKTIGISTVNNGKAYLVYDSTKLNNEKYTITTVYGETSTHQKTTANGILSLANRPIKITVDNETVSYHDKVQLTATVVDKKTSNYLQNGKVVFKINGKTIGTSTVNNGKAYYTYNTINLTAKTYTITAKYTQENYAASSAAGKLTIKKLSTKITLPSVTTRTETKTNITATVKDSKGNLLKEGSVTFKISGKTIGTVKVSNGKATVSYTPSAIVKNYTITATYSGTNNYISSSLSSKLITKLKIYIKYWSSKGDITKNTVLYSNLVKSEITSDIISAAKQGTPYVHLGNGNGKTVFITAGIHGSELSSQAAAIKLINTLATQEIDGDLYIMPFVSPKITGNNTRSIGVNLNSVANKAGTISNNIYLFAKSKNATALGDFHCTMPGGNPGKDVAMGTYSPRSSSAALATYIAKQCGVSKIIYSKAGAEYPGALEDYCNNHGITSVTCEVKTQHGTIASGSITKSYSMMRAFLRYYNLIA